MNDFLDKLINKEERLAGFLGGIDRNSFAEFSQGIDNLSNSMQGMENAGTADFIDWLRI